MLCLRHQSHVMRETIAELNQPMQAKSIPHRYIQWGFYDEQCAGPVIYIVESHHSPSHYFSCAQLHGLFGLNSPQWHKAQDRYCQQGRGWGQLEELAVTPCSRSRAARGSGGTWSLVLGCWEVGLQWLLWLVSFQPWDKALV